LAKNGEFDNRVEKRYDDTDLIIREIIENDLKGERGQLSIKRLNYLHSMYPAITNHEFIYVLSVFILEPIRMVKVFGWRDFVENERLALFIVFRELGRDMGIHNIPPTLKDMFNYNIQYEDKFMKYEDSNHKCAIPVLKLYGSEINFD